MLKIDLHSRFSLFGNKIQPWFLLKKYAPLPFVPAMRVLEFATSVRHEILRVDLLFDNSIESLELSFYR